ncbi:hypothetical protein Rhopal_002397-T1 [Rhodotorula paludigena]|uniref:ACB domain-containing protein n=1 Tax=Rhodotorula paludigena TaxID=86838 RepID=A0AAV5GJ04_9BASI|nr:hypothetical protein Rhopal_002397-T1 [Rhodotorula paludigena]
MTSISSYSTRSRPPPHPLATNPQRFERAVDIIQSLPKSGPIQTTYDQKLELYSVYKQATEGDVKSSRPGILDILGRAKWDAWNKRKGSSQLEAERLYVEALLRILRSFSDRTQAVELLRELEYFELDEPLQAPAGVRIRPRGDTSASSETGSDSSSTASYDRDPRAMPPPAPMHASHHSRLSQSRRAPPSVGSRARGPASHLSPDDVAPPLPGYGPPRTRADPVRTPERLVQRRHRGGYPADEQQQDPYTSESSADERVYHPAASVGAPPSVRSRLAPAGVSRIPPPPPALPHMPASSLRSVAGSAAPSVVAPLTANNLLRTATAAAASPARPVGPPSLAAPASASAPAPPPPSALDAALDRIQTSLTALHERLTLLETASPAHQLGGASSSSAAPAGLSLLKETVQRLLEAVHLRRRRHSLAPPPGSPVAIGLRQRQRASSSSSAPSLVLRLVFALLGSARRLAGDLCVVFAIAVLVGRLRGVDVLGLVVKRLVRGPAGGGGGRGRLTQG